MEGNRKLRAFFQQRISLQYQGQNAVHWNLVDSVLRSNGTDFGLLGGTQLLDKVNTFVSPN